MKKLLCMLAVGLFCLLLVPSTSAELVDVEVNLDNQAIENIVVTALNINGEFLTSEATSSDGVAILNLDDSNSIVDVISTVAIENDISSTIFTRIEMTNYFSTNPIVHRHFTSGTIPNYDIGDSVAENIFGLSMLDFYLSYDLFNNEVYTTESYVEHFTMSISFQNIDDWEIPECKGVNARVTFNLILWTQQNDYDDNTYEITSRGEFIEQYSRLNPCGIVEDTTHFSQGELIVLVTRHPNPEFTNNPAESHHRITGTLVIEMEEIEQNDEGWSWQPTGKYHSENINARTPSVPNDFDVNWKFIEWI